MKNEYQGIIQKFICLSLVSLFCLPVVVCASDENDPLYLSVDFVTGFSEMNDIQNSGAILGSLSNLNDTDITGGFAGAVGYEWNQFRFEAEYLWRYRFDFGAQFENAGAGTGVGSNIETHSFSLKSVWVYKNHTDFSPYIGGSLGWASHDADSTRGDLANPAIASNLNSSSDSFIWSFIFGSTYSLFDEWEIDASYRYSNLGDVEIGPFTDGGLVETEYTSHDLTIGINYFF